MVEFFDNFNQSFFAFLDFIALVFPFCLCLSLVIFLVCLPFWVYNFFRGDKNEKR